MEGVGKKCLYFAYKDNLYNVEKCKKMEGMAGMEGVKESGEKYMDMY